MSRRYLITQSLLNSWSYALDASAGDKAEEAMDSFLRDLRHEPQKKTQATLAGAGFEREAYREAAGTKREPYDKWDGGVRQIGPILQGAQIQVKARRLLKTEDMTFLVYGILDALKAGVIYDVKYKTKPFSQLDLAGSYLKSAQHPTYFYLVPEALEFQYLVSDGEDLYIERYTPRETRPVKDIIGEFVASLDALHLLDLYREQWEAT